MWGADAVTTQPSRTAAETRQTITESKLSRVEMIAREALEILGESAPDDLRRSVAEERARHEHEMAGIIERLEAAAGQVRLLQREVEASARLADDRFNEAEEAWALAGAHAAELSSVSSTLDQAHAELELLRVTNASRAREVQRLSDTIRMLSRELDQVRAEIDTLRTELAETTEDRDDLRQQADEALHHAAQTERSSAQLRDELQARLNTLTAQLEETRLQADAERSRAEQAEQATAAAQGRVSEAQDFAQSLMVERDAAVTESERRTGEADALRRDMAALSSTLAARDQEIVRLIESKAALPPAPTPTPTPQPPVSADAAPADEALHADLLAQLARADARAGKYQRRAEQAEASLHKAAALVRRARRRSARRTEQFAGTVDTLSAMRIKTENLEADRLRLSEQLRWTTRAMYTAGGLAGLFLILALIVS
jgi:chromosome segregation ATPase